MTDKDQLNEKKDVAALLREGHTVQINPQGNSMFPMFVDGRGDAAVISPISDEDIKVGAVILFQRSDRKLVLHRVCRIDKDGTYFVGDNQTKVEGPIRRVQLLGVLEEFIRKGRRWAVTNPLYWIPARMWLFVRPIRPVFSRPVGVVYRFIKSIFR